MRRLRATAAAFLSAAALSTGWARAEAPSEDRKPATAQPAATSLPESAGVVAGAVLLQAALVGMGLLIFPRRRVTAVSSAIATPVPRR